ncbi:MULTISPECIES: FadR/GntR family transcriptional regulator [Niastella]|uniref:FadR family transcriptional regulator n=1 Tax=Niastella soli TaxID=2821487 RepID=A0ABS3YWX5_9BACT|nr:FadR/GntR family transcriptional regulator [Niastella soli]MBO9202426.1 FadR family transcriptional regulator [Niastella soli]
MMNNLVPRRSLADEVAAQLQQQITLGKYKTGEKLPIEPELMKTFGVGRSTIREAIKTLVNSGLLRVQQGLGTFVEGAEGIKEPLPQRLKRADFKDLDEVRQLIEMKIAEKAAANRTDDDLAEIRHWLAARKKAALEDNLVESVETDIRFHTAIAVASKNEVLADLYKSLTIQIKNWFLTVYNDATDFRKTQTMHEQLLKAIEANDTRKAWNIAAKIIGHTAQ